MALYRCPLITENILISKDNNGTPSGHMYHTGLSELLFVLNIYRPRTSIVWRNTCASVLVPYSFDHYHIPNCKYHAVWKSIINIFVSKTGDNECSILALKMQPAGNLILMYQMTQTEGTHVLNTARFN